MLSGLYIGLALTVFALSFMWYSRRKKKAATPCLDELLDRIPRDWEREHFVLSGSAALAFRGIRDVRDLDIVVSPSLASKLSSKFPREGNRLSVSIDGIDVFYSVPRVWSLTWEDLVGEADEFDGYKVQSLRHVLAMKCLIPNIREKDRPDMVMLANLISEEPGRSKRSPKIDEAKVTGY